MPNFHIYLLVMCFCHENKGVSYDQNNAEHVLALIGLFVSKYFATLNRGKVLSSELICLHVKAS